MDIKERIKIVNRLQNTSAEVFNTVIRRFEKGISEADIANLISLEYNKRGIKEFWYTVPHTVFIGVDRFQIGTTTLDYAMKAPSRQVFLEEGSVVFIDLTPMDPKTKIWGDWASMVIFHPRKKTDDKQVTFLKEMRNIHRNGLTQITSKTSGVDVVNYYTKIFKEIGAILLDVRNNVGHSIHEGPKDKAQRVWLDQDNINPLGEGIFAIEPGGVLKKENGKRILAGRFEECVYIPKEGSAIILGSKDLVSLII